MAAAGDSEEHGTPYSVGEVAKLTGLSRQTITSLFENEPGVLVINRPEEKHKRRYRTIRIPRSVYERVLYRITNK